MKRKLKIPYGFQDFLPDECYNKDILEKKLSAAYCSYGYNKVETPTIEYYDTFHDVSEPEKLKKMFKLTDNDGSLLALRPDTTLQICRMASKLNLNNPQRMYYIENSFEYQDNKDNARTREFSQIGIELLGDSGLDGDVEIIQLAIESFLKAGLEDFIIEIGNNNFFKGLSSESGLNDKDVTTLTALINRKDMLGMEMFLQKKKTPPQFMQKLLILPSLFGGKEVLKKAKSLTDNPLAENALIQIEYIFNALKSIGYDKYISIDMGMLNGLNYYSGLVMKGYSRKLGLCLLDGGRYDTICSSFGYSTCAVGFAIGTKRLLLALDESGKLKQIPPCDYAYSVQNTDLTIEFNFTERLRKQDNKLVKVFAKTRNALIEYCRENKINKAFFLSNNAIEEIDMRAELCSK